MKKHEVLNVLYLKKVQTKAKTMYCKSMFELQYQDIGSKWLYVGYQIIRKIC